MSQQWNSFHNRAKTLESRLESNIQKYSSIAQRINADFSYDEEDPLIDNKEEQELASDIERDLGELSDCINSMRNSLTSSSAVPNQHQDALVKRYNEIHFDYSTEFRNIMVII